jgi:hypothetical protein
MHKPVMMTTVMGGGAAAPAFKPTDIATLEAEHDPTVITNLFKDAARSQAVTADADNVGGVLDSSGKTKHLSVDGTRYAQYKANINNGKGVLRFAGSSRLVTPTFTSIPQPRTFFFVIRRSGDAYNPFLDNSGWNSHTAFAESTNAKPGRIMHMYSGAFGFKTQLGIDKNFHVLTLGMNANDAFVRLDGKFIGVGQIGSAGIVSWNLGGTNNGAFSGDIQYSAMASGNITAKNIADIENYLSTLSGISVSTDPNLPMTGITSWLDPYTITSDDGEVVGGGSTAYWASRSHYPYGLNNYMTVTPANEVPHFSEADTSVLFDGVTNVITHKTGANLFSAAADTQFMVVKFNSIPAGDGVSAANILMLPQAGASYGLLVGNNNQVMRYGLVGATPVYARQTIAADTWYILESRRENGRIYLSLNGGEETSVAADNTTNLDAVLLIGGEPRNLAMNLRDNVTFNVALSALDRAAWRNYLNAKWSVY